MTKPTKTKSTITATADTIYRIGLAAAHEGVFKSDVVLNALKFRYPKYFGINGKDGILIDEDVSLRLKEISNSEHLEVSEILRISLKNTFP
jgi:hypothetical protein